MPSPTGDRMPLLGLGTWKSDPGDVYQAVREAIRIGYRHIDCASLYGNEAEIGQALRDAMRDGEVTRKDLWITSKLWSNAHGQKNVEPALKKTLADLGLDYVDLYMIHWPIPLKPTAVLPGSAADFMPPSEVPIHATWAGMEAAVGAGLTRHLGVSNFSVKKFASSSRTARSGRRSIKSSCIRSSSSPRSSRSARRSASTSRRTHRSAPAIGRRS